MARGTPITGGFASRPVVNDGKPHSSDSDPRGDGGWTARMPRSPIAIDQRPRTRAVGSHKRGHDVDHQDQGHQRTDPQQPTTTRSCGNSSRTARYSCASSCGPQHPIRCLHRNPRGCAGRRWMGTVDNAMPAASSSIQTTQRYQHLGSNDVSPNGIPPDHACLT